MSLTVALWTHKGSVPPELLRYRLMGKFGWTPDQLRAMHWRDVQEILTCMAVESEVEERRRATRRR